MFKLLKRNSVPELTEADYDFALEFIKESKRFYLKQFPKGKFVILTSHLLSIPTSFYEKLTKNNIAYIKFTNIPWPNIHSYKNDPHYKPKGNKFLSKHIAQKLQEYTD